VLGLLALMVLHEARRLARMDSSGLPVPLPDQDRSRWDAEAILEGTAILEAALRAGAPGPFQIEAAISATHCRARTAGDTDWNEIAELYSLLERARPAPSVRVNRAFAVGRAHGARAGLALLDGSVAGYPYADLVRGALLEELGEDDAAITALERAAAAARNAHEVRQIGERIVRIRSRA
jgi:RNA polymerase sigma-70 factor (ECF subfamily)